jgi:hypothetical protein
MLHLKRNSKALIRLILLLFLVQFLVPSFVQAGTQEINSLRRETSVATHHDSGISIAVFLKENTEEENEATEKLQLDLEILDFSFHSIALTLSHAPVQWCAYSVRLSSEPLFKLFCVFLI